MSMQTIFARAENIQLEGKRCACHGALQTVMWGGPSRAKRHSRSSAADIWEALEERAGPPGGINNQILL